MGQLAGYTSLKVKHSRSTQPALGSYRKGTVWVGGGGVGGDSRVSTDTCRTSPPSLGGLPPPRGLQLHAGQEAFGYPAAVVAQLCGVDGAGRLGVDDGGAPEALRAVARLEVQLSLVVAPGAVGQGHDRLPTVLQAPAAQLQGHALDEAPVRVVAHGRGVSARKKKDRDGRLNSALCRPLVAERCKSILQGANPLNTCLPL